MASDTLTDPHVVAAFEVRPQLGARALRWMALGLMALAVWGHAAGWRAGYR
jgi:hypothetical protein